MENQRGPFVCLHGNVIIIFKNKILGTEDVTLKKVNILKVDKGTKGMFFSGEI